MAQAQLDLSASTERASLTLARFETGGLISRLRGRCEGLAEDLRAILEAAVDERHVSLSKLLELRYQEATGPLIERFARLFDISRAEASGFSPPKYHTAYDELVDGAMMERMDAVLAAEPKLTFALPFDLNAWAPAHNSVYSKGITGDPAKDLVGNRTKRFFLESGALTRASRMELGVDLPGKVLTRAQITAAGARLRESASGHRPVLVQTYARDTGAVLTTLSVSLYVHGQRYRCVCLGCGSRATSRLNRGAAQTPSRRAQVGHVPARDRDRLAPGKPQLGRATEQRTELDRSREVGDVLAVNADEVERLPAVLHVAERRPQQVAPVLGDDAHEIAVRLDVQDRSAADQPRRAGAGP